MSKKQEALLKLLSVPSNTPLTPLDLQNFVNQVGIKNLHTRDLNKILAHFGIDALNVVPFTELYYFTSSKESSKASLIQSWCQSIFSVLVAIAIALLTVA